MSLKNISSNEFSKEVIESKKYNLVDFWAPWCVPCQMMGPILEELASDPELKEKLDITKINTEEEENQALAFAYQIRSIPNMKLFYEGKVVKDFLGYRPIDQFKEELMDAIKG